mmetsp:Transcript_111823/g.311181  ORF Transcript_111823/g.311181 Transcript_111823/m.311181 type:complete len:224 (-) Transcript_111823:388-1059(-)
MIFQNTSPRLERMLWALLGVGKPVCLTPAVATMCRLQLPGCTTRKTNPHICWGVESHGEKAVVTRSVHSATRAQSRLQNLQSIGSPCRCSIMMLGNGAVQHILVSTEARADGGHAEMVPGRWRVHSQDLSCARGAACCPRGPCVWFCCLDARAVEAQSQCCLGQSCTRWRHAVGRWVRERRLHREDSLCRLRGVWMLEASACQPVLQLGAASVAQARRVQPAV